MSAQGIKLTFDNVMQTTDDFSTALLTVWRCQRRAEALSHEHGMLDRAVWPADARANSERVAEESRRAWDALREKGRILYHVASEWRAGEQFLMRLAAGLQASLLTKDLYRTLEASAKSIKTQAFQREQGSQPETASLQVVTEAVAAATVVKPRPRVTWNEANFEARIHLRNNPRISARALAAAIGCSLGLVGKLPAWRAVQEQRMKGPKAKTVSLTRAMEQVTGTQDDPLEKLIREQQADAEPSPSESDPPRARVYRRR